MDSRLARIAPPLYAAATAIVVLVHAPAPLTAVLVAPLVVFAPGFAMVAALEVPGEADYPGRRLVLSISLSLATTALGGLILNALADLTSTSWAIWLVGFTCVCSLPGLLRASSEGSLTAEAHAVRGSLARLVASAPWPQVAALVLAALLVAGAAVLSETSSRSNYDKPLTQLSMVPSAGSGGRSIRLTITNLTPDTEQLDLTVFRGRRTIATIPVTVLSAHSWSREEALTGRVLRATLTAPGGLAPLSEVIWTGRGPLPTLSSTGVS